ncbi:MAG TPA: Ig domain-containing protein, partial [Ilumatobacteraceae bacterium]|nr:Ig domain-containing protein [Ilumatobacteraceae bacterium]
DFTISAANGITPDVVKQFTGNVAVPPTWTDQTIAAAFQVGVVVNDGVSATGTPVPTYSISAGALPDGLSLDAVTGAITGTPLVGGTYSFTVSAGNGIGTPATRVFTGTVAQPAGGFVAINPVRLLDTRDGDNRLAAGIVRHLSIAGLTGIPVDASWVVLNVTATNAAMSGFITVFSCDVAMPLTSNVNFLANQTVASSVSVSLDDSGGVCIVSDVATDVVIDISGAYSPSEGIGRLAAVEPYRIADTREDGGKVAAGTLYLVDVAGHGMPDDATAVLLNITVDGPTSAGFVTAYPCGGDVPLASNLNFLAGQTIANSAVVRIGSNHAVCFYVSKSTDLVVDVNGSYSPSSAVGFPTSAGQQRLLDTRMTGSVVAGTVQELDLNNVSSVPANATSVTLNVTVDGPQRSGFVTVFPCSSGRPLASNINFVAGQTVANSVTVPVGANHKVCVFTTAAADLVVDLNEVYSTLD